VRTILLEFDFSDKDITDIIVNSNPPSGVTIGKPTNLIKAAADINEGGGVFIQIAIRFVQDVHDVSLAMLAAWLYNCCVKSGKKKGRIGQNETVYNKRNIRRIIKNELKNQGNRNKQRRRNKNRPPKKRP
jgi:hypothetical protein